MQVCTLSTISPARMDNKSRVSVPLKLTAVSNKPAEPGKTHPLSALDHAMGLHSLHIIFYYRKYPTGSGDSNQFDLDWLRGSLSEALSFYPSVTGRLTRGEDGNWMVKCNDAGVRILRAKVGTTLDEWLRSADAAEERDLMVWEDMPEDPSIWSPFRIQINDFEGGGAAIALSCSHMHADPTNATMLFKSWTEVHRREPISHPPFYNPPAFGGRGRPVANIDTKSANYYAAKSKAKTPTVKMATATFKFSEAIIKQCLSRVHDKCPDATPFDLLAALFWTRVACLKLPTHDNKSSISICIDFRKLMHAPLPYGSFGNAQHFSLLSLDAVKLHDAGLGHVVRLIHRHVSSIKEEQVLSVIDWFESKKGEGGKFAPPFRMYGPELTCVSMEHMIISPAPKENSTHRSLTYAAMFEKDEKPVHVSYHVGNVEGEGLIMVMPSLEEGMARTVMVTLPGQEVALLCEDQAILDLHPTMVFSGR